jgi:hypothetical protein
LDPELFLSLCTGTCVACAGVVGGGMAFSARFCPNIGTESEGGTMALAGQRNQSLIKHIPVFLINELAQGQRQSFTFKTM